jgi:hypothetical protein
MLFILLVVTAAAATQYGFEEPRCNDGWIHRCGMCYMGDKDSFVTKDDCPEWRKVRDGTCYMGVPSVKDPPQDMTICPRPEPVDQDPVADPSNAEDVVCAGNYWYRRSVLKKSYLDKLDDFFNDYDQGDLRIDKIRDRMKWEEYFLRKNQDPSVDDLHIQDIIEKLKKRNTWEKWLDDSPCDDQDTNEKADYIPPAGEEYCKNGWTYKDGWCYYGKKKWDDVEEGEPCVLC